LRPLILAKAAVVKTSYAWENSGPSETFFSYRRNISDRLHQNFRRPTNFQSFTTFSRKDALSRYENMFWTLNYVFFKKKLRGFSIKLLVQKPTEVNYYFLSLGREKT
jgi:hypothetical protein